jgi:DNA primase
LPAGYYGDEVIEQVRSRVDIVALISGHVKLRKTGKNYVGLCPFHEEKTPSFSVDPDKQLFYCFGCGAGGNVFSFLMRKEGMTFPEAVRVLAERAGIRLPSPRARGEEEAAMKERRRLRAALEFAQKKYRETLSSSRGGEALKYLKGRGLTPEVIEKFGLGYAPDEWEFISLLGVGAGFERVDMSKAGLLIERQSGGYYDRFRQRITFPIWDSAGDIVGFGGRALGDEQPKYLNSPDTPLFRKGKELYALNLAKPSIRQQGTVCIMEGYMDVITSFQYGIDYTVGGMGTALSREQARSLLLLSQKVLLAYDQDEAGKRAAHRSIEVFRDAGGRTYVVTFKDAKDPDEYLRSRGKDAFGERLGQALPDVAFLYEEARRTHGTAGVDGKVRIKDAMLPVLASLESEFEQSAYIEEISRDLGVRKDSLTRDVVTYRRKTQGAPKHKKSENRDTSGYDNQPMPEKRGNGRTGGQAGNPPSDGEVSVVRKKAEEGVIRCLIEDTGLSHWGKENLTPDDFADLRCREAYVALRRGPFGSIEDEKLLGWLAELCARFGPVGQPERILRDCLRKLKELRLAELRDRIAVMERERNEDALSEVRREYQSLLKQVKSVGEAGGSSFSPVSPRREGS